MSDHRAIYPVRTMCRLLGLSPSGYYAWRRRGPSSRARENAALTEEILEIHARSDGTYGAPRIHAELRARGRGASLNRVARLMRAAEIEGASRRRKAMTTRRAPGAEAAEDLVDRDFSAAGPDELWVADITYVPTQAGFLYLAVVLDGWSRRVVGWSMAPLILVPVQLAQSSVRENFKLTWTKDEIEANLSLEAKLRQDFNVRLPEMPAEDNLDVEDYLARVEKAVARKDRWAVERNEVHLNFFSFSKLLIFKDLDPETWPEGSRPADHPLVRQLFGSDGFAHGPPGIGEDEPIDDDRTVAGLRPVVDADSSQTLAVLDAVNGRDLVIQGPPGTGKSQTITNLIGEALARDRKVLFVAEKMAALEVVKRRLDTVHLGDACLELHSHKTNKRAVLDELKRTLAMGRPQADGATEDGVLLHETRSRLNDYARAVNSPVGQSELTPHELVGRLARLAEEGLAVDDAGLPVRDSVSWSGEEFIRRREVVREIQELVRSIGVPREHAWWPCGRLHFVPTDRHSVREAIGEASAALRRLGGAADVLGTRLDVAMPFGELKTAVVERMIRTARRAAAAPPLSGADHRNPDWLASAGQIAEVAEAARAYGEIRSEHDAVLIPEAWDRDLLAERQALRAYGDRWWGLLSGPLRRARGRLRGLCRGAPPKASREQLGLVDAILEARRLRRRIEEAGDLVAGLFPGLVLGDRVETYGAFAEAATWLVALHRDVAEGLVGDEIHRLLDHMPDRAEVEAAADACERSLESLADGLEALGDAMALRADRFEPGDALDERSCGDLDAWLRTARDSIPSIHDVVRFNQLEKRAAEAGIPEVSDAAASRPDAAGHLAALFEHACYAAWLDSAFRERPVLAEFDGATHAGIVDRFRELDRAQFRRNRIRIAELHWEQLPRYQGGGQLGILKREFQKKTRHMPVRRLMEKAGRAIQCIKPVFMMSPLSIAKYVPPGSVEFDMVVFDEASQVRPVEALGTLMRGRQAIVVGDSKQLPPTSFFDRMSDDGDEEASQTADLESILGMFCAQGAPERMLRWHYRSRHESLITVSNHEFYDNRLVVFPSPDAGKVDTGLVFRHDPEADYQRRGINTAEAKTVALAVMEHARATPGLTLGVAAFSNVQARRIEDEVDILRRRDPSCEDFFAGHPEEPFFVKNLENVQGDERDVILISIGYGKIDGSYLPMNFGPLNRDGGERRLNVLITRARRRCVVYCNFVGAELDLRRSRARGVEALKTFLEYARTGNIDVPEITGRGADSPFEEAVADRLRARGHDVTHQVGSAGFFIDLAVVDPGQRGRYLLGIECDGASYHSARSARDRDRLRQQVLEGLGWKIHRIWSTDWFRDPERELVRVEEALQEALAARATPPPAPMRKAPQPLKRAPEPEPEVAPPTRPYTVARLDVGVVREPLHEISPGQLSRWIAQVVEVESPVHLYEVTQRIREAAGVGRSGSRIRAQMRLGASVGANQAPPPTSTPRSPRLRRSSCSAPRAAPPDPASS
ncbi:MAG: IS3 family transposase [Gemmatimonadetes bacterium]|nr:IS3 family transposase [Gemmatimonadota bacterium]